MAEIDPVVLELRANVDKYLSDLRSTTTKVDTLLGTQEKRVNMLENQFRQSSGAISGHLKSIAATVAATMSVNQIMEYADSYTRLQNNIRVAGVAADEMKAVQDRLFASAQKYGVELTNLSSLFSTLTQASKELGATQAQVFTLTDSVSAALKVSGASAESAAGALLQLGQALRSPKIQAEEYNSLLDGLYPLLEAAANGSAKWGGSVAKLTADVKNGKVASSEFFQAILAGAETLEGKANKATLTLSASFTTLSNALTVYFGEADKVNGASVAMSDAIAAVAENLDSIIPAIATVAAALGVGFVTNATKAAIAAGGLTAAGQSMLAILGGPIGIAITAVTVAFAGLAAESANTQRALDSVDRIVSNAASALDDARDKADTAAQGVRGVGAEAATSEGKVRSFAGAVGEAAQKLYDLAKARQAAAIADLEARRKEASIQYSELWKQTNRGLNARVEGNGSISHKMFGLDGWLADLTLMGRKIGALTDPETDLQAKMAELSGSMDDYDAAIAAAANNLERFAKETTAPKAAASDGKKKKGSGPTEAEAAANQAQEMARLRQEQLRAELSVTTDAEDRARLSRELLQQEYKERLAKILSDKSYGKGDKAAKRKGEQIAELKKLYGVSGTDADGAIVVDGKGGSLNQAITRERDAQLQRESADKDRASYDAKRESLQDEQDLADSTAERRRIALEMLKLDYEYQRAQAAAIAEEKNGLYSDAEKAAAAAKIAVLDQQYGDKKKLAERANESPLQSFSRGLNKSDGALADQAEGYVVSELENVRDGIKSAITKAIGTDDPLISGLLNMLIEQVLLKPIAAALSNASGSSSGDWLSSLLNIGMSAATGGASSAGAGSEYVPSWARASGGRVQAGQIYRVNEGAAGGRGEFFRPDVAGQIIPLGRTNAVGHGGAGNRVFQISVDARNSVTPDGFAEQLSQQILTQAATMDAHAAKAVMKQVPGRVTQYQRDGN